MLGGGPASCGGLGLGLFLRKGMAAWTEAWLHCALQRDPPSSDRPSAGHRVPQHLHAEVVMLLATMALDHFQEVMR